MLCPFSRWRCPIVVTSIVWCVLMLCLTPSALSMSSPMPCAFLRSDSREGKITPDIGEKMVLHVRPLSLWKEGKPLAFGKKANL